MKKLDGTVTLSILDEDNRQRVIFRIIPLCTKEGMIFQNRKASYPDFGSLRIIPDKREQSSFKDRMREMGNLCCVQLINDGKELTKIRQNRNYDPKQDECNQYAIYSDVICGFEQDAVFEVFQENEDFSKALTDSVLLQKGKVLYGPVARDEDVQWDTLKPFGNENYIMHTVEDIDGNNRTYYWNPDAIVTWRQRKRELKQSGVQRKAPPVTQEPPPKPTPSESSIPIGAKLEILNESLTNEEQITELNLPLPEAANRLEQATRPAVPEVPVETPYYNGTPMMAQGSKHVQQDKQNSGFVHGVVEKQIKAHQSVKGNAKPEIRPLDNPVETLKHSLEYILSIPTLHQELVGLFLENELILRSIFQAKLSERHVKYASFTSAKAELDDIEGRRISVLLELDKAKADYQQFKEEMYKELSQQKKNEIEALEKRISELETQKRTIVETLTELNENLKNGTDEVFKNRATMDIASNGSDIILSPTIGTEVNPDALVERIRSTLSGMGFMCKRDCVMELMVMLSLHDEFCVIAASIPEAELYMKTVLRALGLMNVTAWPSVFGTLRVVSLLPENDLRTPTIEVIKNKRTPIKANGHITIRLIDVKSIEEAGSLPVFRAPEFKSARAQEKRNDVGTPVSLRTIHAFTNNVDLMRQHSEEWFDSLTRKLQTVDIEIPDDILNAMRVYARAITPKVKGGFIEVVDTTTLIWVVPILLAKNVTRDQAMSIISDLPKCMKFTFQN